MKIISISRSKGWYKATKEGFVVDYNKKKKIDIIGVI